MKSFALMALCWDRKYSSGTKAYFTVEADTLEEAINTVRDTVENVLTVFPIDTVPLAPNWKPLEEPVRPVTMQLECQETGQLALF